MPFTLTFHSLAEKTPTHGEQILFFSTGLDSFDAQVGNLRESTVEYYWDEFDEDDEATGNSCCFSSTDEDVDEEGRYKLALSIADEGFLVHEDEPRKHNIYWISSEEFWNTFPEPQSNY